MNKLFLGLALFFIGNILIWFQTNGQFLWKWFEKNPLLLSILFGSSISYCFIYATRYLYQYFDGMLWSIKFVGFAVGILSYAGLTYYYMGEAITMKTFLCIILAVFIICIQIFLK